MNINMTEKAKSEVKEIVMNALGQLIADGKLPAEPLPPFSVEQPADSSHGDFSCNAALASAKTFRKNPRETAGLIAESAVLDGTLFDRIEVAGPGFINFFLKPLWFGETVTAAINEGADYGKTDLGGGKR
ncbi:MAG: arginine--tRNA ligase, partial [Ruminiclostridium sp.]|nr:arginine--tRNA ligase [Ruminiclostridium sp.]